MLSEDFDKKIRDAADHHYPTYDERAWKEMNKLLDKHLPVEEDRRRRGFFILLLFLLLGGGAAWYLSNGSGKKSNEQHLSDAGHPDQAQNEQIRNKPVSSSASTAPAAIINEKPANQEQETTGNPGSTPVPVNGITTVPSASTNLHQKEKATDKPVVIFQPAVSKTKYRSTNTSEIKARTNRQNQLQPDLSYLETKPVPADNTGTTVRSTQNKPGDPATADANGILAGTDQNPPRNPSNVDPSFPSTNHTDAASNDPRHNQTEPIFDSGEITATKQAKKLSSRNSYFFIAVSAAPDVSFTNGDALGRMKLLGGFGLGYTFRDRLTLRTGLYTGRKRYTASPANYKGSALFYQYYPNLQKVEADCKVQEIPLLLSYNFGKKKQHQWSATAGVSTLLMKEETYDYFYKYNAWGPTINRSYSIYNQNKHPFSVLTLAAGYQHQVGKKISLLLEPYIKLPLSGVGQGKIKLNSIGTQFTITYNPFNGSGKPRITK